jgi:hypothetical protein
MQTTRLEITGIPIETFKDLNEIAQQNGQSPADFVRALIETEVLAAKPLDEILAPIDEGLPTAG